jgi:hypothetical protein
MIEGDVVFNGSYIPISPAFMLLANVELLLWGLGKPTPQADRP